jgi:hypothetical protein
MLAEIVQGGAGRSHHHGGQRRQFDEVFEMSKLGCAGSERYLPYSERTPELSFCPFGGYKDDIAIAPCTGLDRLESPSNG